MTALRTFLAEAYAPSSAQFAPLLEQARLVASRSAPAAEIEHLRSILVREDETCFHLFQAASMDVLRTAIDATEIHAQRIVEVTS